MDGYVDCKQCEQARSPPSMEGHRSARRYAPVCEGRGWRSATPRWPCRRVPRGLGAKLTRRSIRLRSCLSQRERIVLVEDEPRAKWIWTSICSRPAARRGASGFPRCDIDVRRQRRPSTFRRRSGRPLRCLQYSVAVIGRCGPRSLSRPVFERLPEPRGRDLDDRLSRQGVEASPGEPDGQEKDAEDSNRTFTGRELFEAGPCCRARR